MIDIHNVDRCDCRIRVGVRGEQRTARPGHQVHRCLEEVDAVHPRHPIVGEDGSDLVAAEDHFSDEIQPIRAVVGAQYAVVGPVLPPKVACDRSRHAGVIVHGQQNRTTLPLGHCVGHVPTSSKKHQRQFSPGSADVATGCPTARA